MLEKEMRALPCLQLHVYRPHDNIDLFACVHFENEICTFILITFSQLYCFVTGFIFMLFYAIF